MNFKNPGEIFYFRYFAGNFLIINGIGIDLIRNKLEINDGL
jgi:hypothetical protein